MFVWKDEINEQEVGDGGFFKKDFYSQREIWQNHKAIY